jgi:hypothetical protein
MKWKKSKQIVNGRVGKKMEIVFVPDEELPEIDNMTSSCGCSIPRLEDGKIKVKYTPASIPFHLAYQGEYRTTKNITVNFKNKTTNTLSFTAIIKR